MLKFGDRTQIGAVHLSTSLVADLQLVAAAMVWGYAAHLAARDDAGDDRARGLALGRGALRQRGVSVIILIAETIINAAEPHPPRPAPCSRPRRHHSIFLLILRRMRAPLILLIALFAIAVLGLTLVPGPVVDGETSYLSFFRLLLHQLHRHHRSVSARFPTLSPTSSGCG